MTTSKSLKIRSFDEGEIEQFKNVFINENRGKPIVLLRFQDIKSLSFIDFLQIVPIKISELYPGAESHYSYYCYGDKKNLLIGVAPIQTNGSNGF